MTSPLQPFSRAWFEARLDRRLARIVERAGLPAGSAELLKKGMAARLAARRKGSWAEPFLIPGGKRLRLTPRQRRIVNPFLRKAFDQALIPLFKAYAAEMSACGFETPAELASLLRRLAYLARKEGTSLDSQANALAGDLLERLIRRLPAFERLALEADDLVAAFNKAHPGMPPFKMAQFFSRITNKAGRELSDGMFLAFNDAGEVLVVIITEVKKQSQVYEMLPQFAKDIDRILSDGIRLASLKLDFPADKIRLAGSRSATGSGPRLAGFAEDTTLAIAADQFRKETGHALSVERVSGAERLNELARKLILASREAIDSVAGADIPRFIP